MTHALQTDPIFLYSLCKYQTQANIGNSFQVIVRTDRQTDRQTDRHTPLPYASYLHKHFVASSIKDVFDNIEAQKIIDFIKETRFYKQL